MYVTPVLHQALNSSDIPTKKAAQQEIVRIVREEMNSNNRTTLTMCDTCNRWYSGSHSCSHGRKESDTIPEVTAADGPDNFVADPGDMSDTEDKSSDISYENSDNQVACTWSKAATKLVISLYKKNENKVEKGMMRKKELWAAMSSEMSKHGYKFSPEQINGRWKTLLRAYKAIKDNDTKSGAGKKNFDYMKELDEIFGKDPAITPVVTASSTSAVVNKRKHENDSDSSLESKKSETKRPKCSPTSEMVSLLKQHTQNQEDRYKAEANRREQHFQERMQMMQQIVDVLKTFKQ